MIQRIVSTGALLTIVIWSLVVSGPPRDAQVTIALWGDSRENLDGACEDIATILLEKIKAWDVQVHTGDFTHDGSAEMWERSLHVRGMDSLFVRGRILVCTSNHDAGGEGRIGGDKEQNWDRFTANVLPVNSADHSTHFYAWQKGNVHVICCDSYFTDSTVMQNWLDRLVQDIPPDDWIVAVWHEPAYDLTYKKPYLPTCLPWLRSLSRHRGVFVVNGHAHLYLRTAPLTPEGEIDTARGIVHIINGTGGASWKDPVSPDPRIAFTPRSRSFPCITFLTFRGDTATIRTVDARPENALVMIDQYTWVK
jgi:hypothetical protein